MGTKQHPSKEELERLFVYDDGKLIRKINSGPAKRGVEAGSKKSNGYIYVSVGGELFLCHRLIWILFKGYNPENDIDHINRDRTDNRIDNLREVSRTCNLRNSKLNGSALKIRGVSLYKDTGLYAARISYKNRTRYLGRYVELTDACYARFAAEQCLGWKTCSGMTTANEYIRRMVNG